MSDKRKPEVEDYEVLMYCLQDAEKYAFMALRHGVGGRNSLEENNLEDAKKELKEALRSINEKLEEDNSNDE